MLRCLVGLLALVSSMVVVPVAPALAQGAPYCWPGETPAFYVGLATLQARIGASMGSPVECEHPSSANGDTLQNTTNGLAFYRKSTNTPTFTDGFNHWALTPLGVVTWTGSSIDPPQPAAPAEQSLDCALIVYDPSVMMHSTTFESCSGDDALSVDLHDVNGYMFANVWLQPATFAQVSIANVRKQVVQLPMDAGALAGGALLIERDPDGMFSVSVRWP